MDSSKKEVMDHIAYDLLSMDTLQQADERFIHQYVVDTYAAQTADLNTKPITIVLALVGLYLHIEKKYTGRQVQEIHMYLANINTNWPAVIFPKDRGTITASVVLQKSPGDKRNAMIELWAAAVWFAWKDSHNLIKNFVDTHITLTH